MTEDQLRAVVFVDATTKKGTSRSGQEYESPLLVLTGDEYAAMPFQLLHDRLCEALRGSGPQLVMEAFTRDSTMLVFEDGTTRLSSLLSSLDKPPTTMPSSSSTKGRSSDGADHD